MRGGRSARDPGRVAGLRPVAARGRPGDEGEKGEPVVGQRRRRSFGSGHDFFSPTRTLALFHSLPFPSVGTFLLSFAALLVVARRPAAARSGPRAVSASGEAIQGSRIERRRIWANFAYPAARFHGRGELCRFRRSLAVVPGS